MRVLTYGDVKMSIVFLIFFAVFTSLEMLWVDAEIRKELSEFEEIFGYLREKIDEMKRREVVE